MSPAIQIRDFHHVVFFTGAGMSAESGVPTYRGKGGIWKHYDYERYACQPAFERDPVGVWEFHNYRRELVGRCQPNDGHRFVTACEQLVPHVTVVTQNIDGLHERAGSSTVHELHGSLWRSRCDTCSFRATEFDAPLTEIHCPNCRAFKRPDIVWFGDMLSADVIESAMSALRNCDLLVSIGTSAVVYPAAELPFVAKQSGAHLVEINPDDTPMSHVYDTCLRTTASDGLRELFGPI